MLPLRPRRAALLPLLLSLGCASSTKSSGGASADSADASGADDSGATAARAAACVVEGGRPAGWADETHGKRADPDLSVLQTDQVRSMTLTVAAADWAAAFTELEALIGTEFGAGGGPGGGGGPPDDGGGPPDDGGGGGGGDPLSLLDGEPSYIQADVTVDGATWCGVGLRAKGNATLVQTWAAGVEKLPLRLNFDKFESERPELEDQRFFGWEELALANGQGDGTLMREVLMDELLVSEGVPAARRGYWSLSLDTGEGPRLLGVYVALEDPAVHLLEDTFGDDSGNLYKPEGDCSDFTCFDEANFEKKTNEEEADYSDVQAFVAALNADRTDAEAWRAGLEAVFAVDAFLRWFAVNTVAENWDTYGGLAHNYYLYANPSDGGRLTWIPWDHNLALAASFMTSGDPLHADVGEEWPLIHHLLADPVYAARYRALLAEALDGQAAPAQMAARAATLKALLQPALFEGGEGENDPTLFNSAAAHDAAIDALVDHMTSRRATIEAALAR